MQCVCARTDTHDIVARNKTLKKIVAQCSHGSKVLRNHGNNYVGAPPPAKTQRIDCGLNITADSCADAVLLSVFVSARLQNQAPLEFIRAAALEQKNAAHIHPVDFKRDGRTVSGHQIDEMG